MLTALLIFTIVMSVGLKFIAYFQAHAKTQVLRNQVVQILFVARQNAIVQGKSVVVCASHDGTQCSDSWLGGAIIYLDDYHDGILHHAQQILHVFSNRNTTGKLFLRLYPKHRSFLLFLPDGKLDQQNGTFWYCAEEELVPQFAIVMAKNGKSRIIFPGKNNLIKDSKGNILYCPLTNTH